MSIAKTVDLVVAAKEAGYAVPAVNIVDDLSLRAVIAAAEQAQSPVIMQTSVKTVKSIGAPLLSTHLLVRRGVGVRPGGAAPRPLPGPRLHHRGDRATAGRRCCSTRPTGRSQQAWQETEGGRRRGARQGRRRRVRDREHRRCRGRCRARTSRATPTATSSWSRSSPPPVPTCSPRSWAPHTACTRPLRSCCTTASPSWAGSPPVPVVLHGGTGLTDDDFRRFIDNGVAKINLSTTLKLAYMRAAQATTSPRPRSRASGSR